MRTLIFIAMLSACILSGSGYVYAADEESKPKSETKKHSKESASEENGDSGSNSDSDSKDTKSTKDEDADAHTLDAQLEDSRFTGDRRIKLLAYDESDVYTITTRYGYQTNIVFGPQEEIELISVGDRSMWQIIPSGNRMFIRPMDEDVTTNMTVLTNKHSYQFDLKSQAADKTTGNIYVAKFVYDTAKHETPVLEAPKYASAPMTPPPAAAPVAPPVVQSPALPASSPFGVGPSVPSAPVPGPLGSGSAPAPASAQTVPPGVWQPDAQASAMTPLTAPAPQNAPVQNAAVQPPVSAPQPAGGPPAAAMTPAAAESYPNYSYTFAGPDEQAPIQVYDDGKYTYLKYRELQKPLPAIVAVDRAGHESPVHYDVKGDMVVVDAVAGELALKHANGTVHIYNEVLNPG